MWLTFINPIIRINKTKYIPHVILKQTEYNKNKFIFLDKIRRKYNALGHVFKCIIDRGSNNYIGISLAGHRDRNKMACFVAGVNPKSLAATSQIVVGDEIVEVNGIVLHGRCHLNASVIIKEMAGSSLHFILLRFVFFFFTFYLI